MRHSITKTWKLSRGTLCFAIYGMICMANAQISYTGPDLLAPIAMNPVELATAGKNNFPLHNEWFQVTAAGSYREQHLYWQSFPFGQFKGNLNFPSYGGLGFTIRNVELFSAYRDGDPDRRFIAYVSGTISNEFDTYQFPVIQPFVFDEAAGFIPLPLQRISESPGYRTSIAQDQNGNFIVVWQTYNSIMSRKFHFQRYGETVVFDTPEKALVSENKIVTDLNVAMNGTKHYNVAWATTNDISRQIKVFRGFLDNFPAGISQVKRSFPANPALGDDGTIRIAMLDQRPKITPTGYTPIFDTYALTYSDRGNDRGLQKIMIEGRFQGVDYPERHINDLNNEESAFCSAPRIAGGPNWYEVGWTCTDTLGFIAGGGLSTEFLSRGATSRGIPIFADSQGNYSHKCLNNKTPWDQLLGDLSVSNGILGISFFDHAGPWIDPPIFPDPTPKSIATKTMQLLYK